MAKKAKPKTSSRTSKGAKKKVKAVKPKRRNAKKKIAPKLKAEVKKAASTVSAVSTGLSDDDAQMQLQIAVDDAAKDHIDTDEGVEDFDMDGDTEDDMDDDTDGDEGYF